MAAIYVRTAGKDTLFAAVTDRQNSLTAVMDVATNKIEKFSYKPWGMRRNASNWTTNVTADVAGRFSRGYCMHEHLPELGLIDMGGRMYNVRTNQFLSPDPYVQSPGSWLSHNRFAYCMQNPVWRTDPSGEFSNYYLGLMFDYAEMMANIYLGIQQMLESVAISIQTTVASAQSAAAGAASSTAYGYTSSYEPADYSYNPSVVNNVYASISQNTQNAVASAKNAVASANAMINETPSVTTSKTESFLAASAATITSFDAVGTGMNALIECGTGTRITDGLGTVGRVFGRVGKGVSVISSGLTIKSGIDNWREGSKVRGSTDFVVGSASLFTTFGMSAGLISNPVGWTILGVSAVYGVGTMIYDLSNEY